MALTSPSSLERILAASSPFVRIIELFLFKIMFHFVFLCPREDASALGSLVLFLTTTVHKLRNMDSLHYHASIFLAFLYVVYLLSYRSCF